MPSSAGHRLRVSLLAPYLVAAVAATTACVDRDLDRKRFACQQSGADCSQGPDGGLPDADPALPDAETARDATTPTDAAPSDGGRPDVGMVDGGNLPGSCSAALTLPLGGMIAGDTARFPNRAEGTCNAGAGTADESYAIDVPFPLARLRARTGVNTEFNAVLHAYRNSCEPTNQVGCDRDSLHFYNNPQLDLVDVAPGRYYLFVDGQMAGAAGIYVLAVEGLIEGGERCDPLVPFLRCEDGHYCGLGEGGNRCVPVFDCNDGFDNDGDGFVDEDVGQNGACTNPPVPDCAPPVTFNPFEIVTFRNAFTDDRALAKFDWAMSGPTAAVPTLLLTDHNINAQVYGAGAGDYQVRFTTVDSDGNAVGCVTDLRYQTLGNLQAEVTWTGAGTEVNLHLLSPEGTRWFDAVQDCRESNCPNGLAWGQAGTADDAFSTFDILGPGPELAFVGTPSQSAAGYEVGVEIEDGSLATRATVRIFCGGELERELGPVDLAAAGANGEGNAFWIAARVTFGPLGCTITPRTNASGGPLVVSRGVARNMR